MSTRPVPAAAITRPRARSWRLLCAAALLFTLGVGLWQATPIQRFRNPTVDQTLTTGQPVTIEGVIYRLTSLSHAPQLPVTAVVKESYPGGVVRALPGAEFVQVVLTLERIDPARDPEYIFCDVTLTDGQGRSWTTDGTVDYVVEGPEAVTCRGGGEEPPPLGTPYDVGKVYQVPADVAGDLRVRVRLSGGLDQHLLELRPG